MSAAIIGVVPLWDEKKNRLWMQPGYMDGVIRAGGLPVMLPLICDKSLIDEIARVVDGVLFTGGQDVHPAFYDEQVSAGCGPICKERDYMEFMLFEDAVLKYDKPALGICRGIQGMNIALGGTLYQDLPSGFKGTCRIEHRQEDPADVPVHWVTIDTGSPLYALVGKDRIEVNSSHHQGIRELARELECMAVSDDGLIEAVYMPDKRFAWGVQWHPELIFQEKSSQLLFDAFVGACAGDRVGDCVGTGEKMEE